MLAVIVLNWNGGEDLLHCLRSVYAQEDCGTEIVVYVPDNASTDGSIAAVERLFPQARVIQNGGNLGFSGGNNPGWRQAVADGAEWVFFLNNDASLEADCLRRMLDVCRAHPEIGAACPKIYLGTPDAHPDGKPRHGIPPEIWFEKGLCEFDGFFRVMHVEATAAERASVWYESPLCTGCCFLTTARLLEATGGFDEGFFAYFEDVDLSMKIRAKGFLCAVIPAALSWHKVGQSTAKDATPGYVFYCARNQYYLVERYSASPAAWKRNQWALFNQILFSARQHLKNYNVTAAATVLQGYQYARRGHQGIRPRRRPGVILKTMVRSLEAAYKIRDWSRRKPIEPALGGMSDAPT